MTTKIDADTVERARRAAHKIWAWWFDKGYPVNDEHLKFFTDIILGEFSAALENATAELRAIRGCDKCDLCEDHHFND